LLTAARNGDLETVKNLISVGVNINPIRYQDQSTPLILTSWQNHASIVKVLLDGKANVNIKNIHHRTALLWATVNNNTEISKLLLDAGADPNVLSISKEIPLILAAVRGNVDIVRMLLDKGADVNDVRTKTNSLPLHFAAGRGRLEVAKLLVSRGSNINAKDNEGNTPLKLAINGNKSKIVSFLRSVGAEE
jgi:ankyrin repeat protein